MVDIKNAYVKVTLALSHIMSCIELPVWQTQSVTAKSITMNRQFVLNTDLDIERLHLEQLPSIPICVETRFRPGPRIFDGVGVLVV